MFAKQDCPRVHLSTYNTLILQTNKTTLKGSPVNSPITMVSSRVAEEKLDVPSLLDPEDMADCDEDEGPDKFSVVTYVSQFYHLFKDSDDSR